MKLSNILIAVTIVFTMACSNKASEHDHGHSHTEGEGHHVHEHDTHQEQEEFTLQGDSIQRATGPASHKHEDGNTPHNH